MKAIFDELKQYNLKRIYVLENIGFDEYDCTLNNKYYLFVQFQNNIIISMSVTESIGRWNLFACLRNNQKHSYEIEHNFEMQNIYDIFYNFCLNNFVNLTMQTRQIYMYLRTVSEIDNIMTCEICTIDFTNSYKLLCKSTKIMTITNLNELYLFYDTINKNEYCTIVNVIFKQDLG